MPDAAFVTRIAVELDKGFLECWVETVASLDYLDAIRQSRLGLVSKDLTCCLHRGDSLLDRIPVVRVLAIRTVVRGHGSDAREKLRCPLPERRLWAEEMHERALEIELRLGLVKEAVSDYKALAEIKREQGQFQRAMEIHRKELELCEKTRLEKGAGRHFAQPRMDRSYVATA